MDEDKDRWSTPEEKDEEKRKAFSHVKPSGTPTHGTNKDYEGDGTADLLCRLSRDAASTCRQRPHGMNADDGYCCSS